MLKVKCEHCGNEQEGQSLIMVLPCIRCRCDTWHYRSDRYEELRQMAGEKMADLIVSLSKGRREG